MLLIDIMATSRFPSLCLFVLLVVLESSTMALSSLSVNNASVAIADDASSQLGRTHKLAGRADSGRRLAYQQWCVAKPYLGEARYQGVLHWVCGQHPG
jgi:hypothetical protein